MPVTLAEDIGRICVLENRSQSQVIRTLLGLGVWTYETLADILGTHASQMAAVRKRIENEIDPSH